MLIDTGLAGSDLRALGESARAIEAEGYDGIWTAEAGHDPFLPAAAAAMTTERVTIGTNIAVAFPRSPLVHAQLAWDLQRASRGRFILGLGTQVKAHIERRYSTPWTAPGPRLREMIEVIRHVWDVWQHGTRPHYAGEHYKFSLMTPFFSPGPLEYPFPQIWIAGVNPYICRLAGELCDGFLMHPLNSRRHFEQVIEPNLRAGLAKRGRAWGDCRIATSAFVVMGKDRDEVERAKAPVKQQIAFYASTPAYAGVLEAHGWGDVQPQLNEKARQGDWQGMADLVTDEMLDVYAVQGVYADVPALLRRKYTGVLDRLSFYAPYGMSATPPEVWRELIAACRA